MRADATVILVCIPVALSVPDSPELLMPVNLSLAQAGPLGAWPDCTTSGEHDSCPVLYLNVATRAGNAGLTVDTACQTDWRHAWRRPDAQQTVLQWLDAEAARGQGGVCIPLGREVDAVVVTSLGGHCGYEGPWSEWNAPDAGGSLRRGGAGTLAFAGCHARIDTQRFGGVALRFADGYGFGDSYAEGQFYGVYDGFGDADVGGTGAAVFRIGDFNTFHYRIEILASGGAGWSQPFPEDNNQ